MRRTDEIKGRVDAVILTIRDDEKNAVQDRLGPANQYVGRRIYRVAQFEGAGRTLTVALYRLPEQGNSPAQAAASDAIDDLDPTLIVLVGVAGAVPAVEFTLGDVLVATRINDLRVQSLVPDRLPELSARSDRIHATLGDRIPNLDVPQEWASSASIACSRPAVRLTLDRFTADRAWNKKVRDSLKAHFLAPRPPRYQTAEIASTDALVKDAAIVQHWLQAVRKIEGFEMEAAGVMAAAARTDALYPVLVVRGISDIVGYKRDPAWTAYACHSAAAFAIALLRSDQLEGVGPLRALPPQNTLASRASSLLPNRNGATRIDADVPSHSSDNARVSEQEDETQTHIDTSSDGNNFARINNSERQTRSNDTFCGPKKPRFSGYNDSLKKGAGRSRNSESVQGVMGEGAGQMIIQPAPSPWLLILAAIAIVFPLVVELSSDRIASPSTRFLCHAGTAILALVISAIAAAKGRVMKKLFISTLWAAYCATCSIGQGRTLTLPIAAVRNPIVEKRISDAIGGALYDRAPINFVTLENEEVGRQEGGSVLHIIVHIIWTKQEAFPRLKRTYRGDVYFTGRYIDHAGGGGQVSEISMAEYTLSPSSGLLSYLSGFVEVDIMMKRYRQVINASLEPAITRAFTSPLDHL